jgi:hypothetical protein
MPRPKVLTRDHSLLREWVIDHFVTPRNAFDKLRCAQLRIPWSAFYQFWQSGATSWEVGARLEAAWVALAQIYRTCPSQGFVPRIPDEDCKKILALTSDPERIAYERDIDRDRDKA